MTIVTYFSYKPITILDWLTEGLDDTNRSGISEAGKIVALNLNRSAAADYDPDKLKYFYLENGREYTGPTWVWNLGCELSTQKVPIWFPINGDMECDAVKWQMSQ